MNNEILRIPIYDVPGDWVNFSKLKGNNAKRMMVVASPDDLEQQRDLLGKILEAVQHDIDRDVHLLPLARDEKYAFASSDLVHNYETLLLFGIHPSQLGFSVNARQRVVKLETLTIVRAMPLVKMADDRDEKKNLWVALKTIFDI